MVFLFKQKILPKLALREISSLSGSLINSKAWVWFHSLVAFLCAAGKPNTIATNGKILLMDWLPPASDVRDMASERVAETGGPN